MAVVFRKLPVVFFLFFYVLEKLRLLADSRLFKAENFLNFESLLRVVVLQILDILADIPVVVRVLEGICGVSDSFRNDSD